jgi:glycolate oxidase FAD binding subunit
MTDISAQLQQQIIAAANEGKKLAIVGGGSKQFLGRAPEGDLLQVGKHRGIVSYNPVELVLTARAGTPLSEIEAVLEEQGQMLAFEPPRFSAHSTLGGTLACNLSGPGRPWQGSIRDHVLGVQLINGAGEHLKFGGQVMKNVAGYDVSRLIAGAMGTLGVITEISLKVLPKPAYQLTLVEEMGLDKAIRVMNERAGQPKPMTAACWLDGKLYTRLAGTHSAVVATSDQWSGEEIENGQLFWQQLRDQQLAFFEGDAPLWRFSVNSTSTNPDIVGDWLIDWGGAQRWLRADASMQDMQQLASEMGGQVSLFRGGNSDQEVFQTLPQALQQIQQRLKQSFDPRGVLNPGRLYSWM